MSADDGVVSRFTFGPLERRGLVAGWRAGQLGALTVGLVGAVLVVRAAPSMSGALGAVVVLGVTVALATWPLAGRTAEQWAPDALRHVSVGLARRRRSRPGPFATLRLLSVDDSMSNGRGASPAVVFDQAAGTYTSVIRATGSGFILAGEADKVRSVTGWSTVLASLARPGSAVHRIQWVARSVPDDGDAVVRHLTQQAALAPEQRAHRSYFELLRTHGSATQSHEVLLAVTVEARGAARAVRAAGGGHGGACAVLGRAVASVRRQLADAGIESSAPLDQRALVSAMRAGYDQGPVPRRTRAGHGPAWPWPMAVDPVWGHACVDGTVHATYWIAEWPRTDVGPDFLGPLLVSDVRRTVSLVMAPVDALEAARRAEQSRTADLADAELRRRGGFLATARRSREEQTAARREGELADGHAQYRFTGYVTVTAADVTALEDACARTEQAAGRCGLELRRCYGDQGRAFACTLPLGRGLP